MFSALRFMVAGIIVALFGGFLLAGVLTTQRGDEVTPAAVTGSPSPMTTEEMLSGMVTEEVEPGVFRVVNDGVRDLSSLDNTWGVVAGQDGSIWLGHDGYPLRLGVADDQAWPLGEWDKIFVAPDGSVFVVNDEGSALRSFDGETWTTELPLPWADVQVTSQGVVWAVSADGTLGYLDPDGSTWQTIPRPPTGPVSVVAGSPAAAEPPEGDESAWDIRDIQEFGWDIREFGLIATESGLWAPYGGGIWHYADGAWDHITYGDPDSGTMPDGVFWGLGPGTPQDWSSDVILYRHDATGWRQWSLREYDMLPGGWDIGPYAVAPDGTFWAGWLARSEEDSCQGVSHFDGQSWVRYLPGLCISGMAIAPDGSMWVIALEEDEEGPYYGPGHFYVITPEAVAASE